MTEPASASTPKGLFRTTLSTPPPNPSSAHALPHRPAQTDHIFACLNDPTTLAQVGDTGIRTRDDALRRPANIAFPCTYVVRLREQDAMVRMVHLRQGHETVPPDMGWSVLQAYAGRGYATEASQAAVRYWTGEFAVSEIVACVDPRNEASVRVGAEGGIRGGWGELGDAAGRQDWCLPGMRRLEQSEVDLLYQ